MLCSQTKQKLHSRQATRVDAFMKTPFVCKYQQGVYPGDIFIILDQRVPPGPGWFGQVRSILETIKIHPRSKTYTPTKQDILTSAVNTSADVTALPPLAIPVVNTTTDLTTIAVAKTQKSKRNA